MYENKTHIRVCLSFRCKIVLLVTLFIYLWFSIRWSHNLPSRPLFEKILIDDDWEFSFDELTWIMVTLPHTPRVEPIEKVEQQWQGTCFYRRKLPIVDNSYRILQFDAAMHEADVWVDGVHVVHHLGGYLPFDVNVSHGNNITVRLRNTDNPIIPPGKTLSELDFNYYGGLYRHVWLFKKSYQLRFDRDIRVQYENVNRSQATVRIRFNITHDQNTLKRYRIRYLLNGDELFPSKVIDLANPSMNSVAYDIKIIVIHPRLWSPWKPNLYTLSLGLRSNIGTKEIVFDQENITIGIRSFEFRSNSSFLFLNGEKLDFLVGTNRHQEYPYVGYAVPDRAQRRDAYKIKAAGFHLVRCSHYPPSIAFLDACDRLGLLVINSIPGWQFFGNKTFQANALDDVRQMMRRDSNHPCIFLWEASLNESPMSREFMARAHAIVKEELSNGLTSGWLDEENIYDVFAPARQHRDRPYFYRFYRAKNNKPIFLAEYGDWEYYASKNHNFNQTFLPQLEQFQNTSRQRRCDGERGLLQQIFNFQEAHNDNRLASKTACIIGDANWVMFDYKRGYAPDIEASGIMDINRLPKFVFYFYQ
ncbi:unnamed protein product [Rotaria sordida]|uniref:Beta-galactosidase n=1 Tax=Rotaria sordida TaxID=392033 RepID=A0A814HTM6_9BILA|nr:unnamed protein product [Rotaria sordida]CAF1121702.1 unnamed protein product [Rotaria sordida]